MIIVIISSGDGARLEGLSNAQNSRANVVQCQALHLRTNEGRKKTMRRTKRFKCVTIHLPPTAINEV